MTPKLWARIKRYQEDFKGISTYLERSKAVSFYLILDAGAPDKDRYVTTDHGCVHQSLSCTTPRDGDVLLTLYMPVVPNMSSCGRIELSWVFLSEDGDQLLDLIMQYFGPASARPLRSLEVH